MKLSDTMHLSNKELLLLLYNKALQSVNGKHRVAAFLQNHPLKAQQIHVCAIGKAANSMAAGAHKILQGKIKSTLIITKQGYGETFLHVPNCNQIESGHPIPNQQSILAGTELLKFIHLIPEHAFVLFLLSGGASSLVEVLPKPLNLEDIIKVNQWLMSSGLDIVHVNAIRKSLSLIKGGRLLNYMHKINGHVLSISDVPHDLAHTIGSGLFTPSRDSTAIVQSLNLPKWLNNLINSVDGASLTIEPSAVNLQYSIIANNQMAQKAIFNNAKSLNLKSYMHEPLLFGDAIALGKTLANRIINGQNGVHIWGGEPTLVLPDNPGIGGRCQSLALSIALHLQHKHNITVLCAATDGSDGPTTSAGAIVDTNTIQCSMAKGLDANHYLERADAGTYLHNSGALFSTGPTGTNVMDVIIGLRNL